VTVVNIAERADFKGCVRCGVLRQIRHGRVNATCRDCRGASNVIKDHWKGRGACLNYDPDMWYPTSSDPRDAEPAQFVCFFECQVREACLDAALEAREEHGIWGGMTYRDRLQYARDKANEAD
jgi:WhiB family redox-sensing transcriptional regulator